MSNFEAIKSELSRVRKLKRNAEATIELLRQDTEKGKLHLRVNPDESFREKVASAIVAEAHPGYSINAQGSHYVDPVEGKVYHKQSNALWNPWSDAIDWRIVSCEYLTDQSINNDFSDDPDWNEYDNLAEVLRAWVIDQGEEFENDGNIPDWAYSQVDEAIGWARDIEQFKDGIEEYEQLSNQLAIDFALSEIKDEIVVEIYE